MKTRFASALGSRSWLLILAFFATLSAAAETALDQYVVKPDPAYSFYFYDSDHTLAYYTDFLMMTSQQWRTSA